MQYHSDASRAKMANNVPLTDEDRWNWLIVLRNEAIKRLENSNGVIVTCSALKHKYRDVLRIANYEHPTVQIHFIYLRGDRKTLQERVANRKGHYMKEEMVNSQFDNLEEPEEVEWDAMSVDVRAPPQEVQHAALEVVKKKLAEFHNHS
jgi:gluconokinase